jgi:uncharacterized membrane protein YphA (DoxX/SURF4 family)
MNKLTYLLELYAPGVLRIGMAVIILWFSIQQFLHNSVWVAYIPESITNLTGLQVSQLVFLNAVFELVFGLAILFGFYTRFASLLLAIHLFDIMWVVGYGATGVRDLGLAIGTLVVFMNGPDVFCIQQRKQGAQTFSASQTAGQSIIQTQSNLQQTSQTQQVQTASSSSVVASQGIRRI